MRAEESTSADHDAAISAVPPSPCAASVASDNLDSSERCAMLVERLVQLFVISTCYVPSTARRLLAPSDLPPTLERVALDAQRGLQTWFAWTDAPRTWFLVAELATVPERHCRGGAIRMFFYDEDGRFVSRGTWALQSECSWMLYER